MIKEHFFIAETFIALLNGIINSSFIIATPGGSKMNHTIWNISLIQHFIAVVTKIFPHIIKERIAPEKKFASQPFAFKTLPW